MKKRGLSLFLATLLLCMVIPASAVQSQNFVSENNNMSVPKSNNTYNEYLEENAAFSAASDIVTLKATEYSSCENAELEVTDVLLWKNGEGSVSWNFRVPADGLYQVVFEYAPVENTTDSIELSLLADGVCPFEEAQTVYLPVYWENDGEIRTDDEGNEFAPNVKKSEEFRTLAASDISGFHNEPFTLALSEGNHTITVKSESQPFRLRTISFSAPEALRNYSDYLKEYFDSAKYAGETITIEGESAISRSKKSIVPLSDNTGACVVPQDAFVSRINYIGSNNWNRPGDTVVWEVEAPETGLYSLRFHYRQKYTMNEVFYRSLKIDGTVPFAQAKEVDFPYTSAWDDIAFCDDEGVPYQIYLEKGKHTLSLAVTMGPLAELCGELDALVYDLGSFYRSIVMITGENPDANRDYNLFTQIEDYDNKLKSYIEKLDDLLNMLYEITGSNSGTAPTNIRNMKDVLQRMRENKYYAHQYKDRYYSNYAALSAWAYERSSMALDIDALFLSSAGSDSQVRKSDIFKSIGFSLKRFITSFISQYKNKKSDSDGNAITLWIDWGRDQAKVLKNLVSSGFTAETGIKVNIRITNATLLQGILSGNGPDCSIQVARSEPVNLAMRGGLYDLSKFSDYDEVMERFMPGADVPYEYKGGSYGVPNTQSFYMLFYRTDIFEQMGLKIPDTWDEFLNTSNILLRKNMQVGLPYTQITAMTQVNTGVGALNIFPTLLMQKGISLYNGDKTASTMLEPETVSTFVQWTDYYNKYGFPKTYDFYNRFRVGLMPMAIVPYTMYATLTAMAPEISNFWSMAPIPGTPESDGTINRSVSAGGTAAIILKDSKHPELSWEFIKWWTSADTQYSYANEVENILGTSARYDTANVEALKKLGWDRQDLKVLIEQWENVNEIPEIPGGYYLARVIDQAFWNTTNGEDPYEMMSKWGTVANNEIERKEKQYGN